jgi:hypothetical protein
MSDDDDSRFVRYFVACQSFDRLLDHMLAIGIKSRGCLIEYDNFRFSEQRPSNRYSLSLPSTELVALLSNLRLKHIRESLIIAQELHTTRLLSSLKYIFLRWIFIAINDI